MSEFEHTGVIVPRFWRDFRGKSLEVKGAACHLITGRHNQGLPGCCEVSLVALADELEVTLPHLDRLLADMPQGFAEYDRANRVLRLPSLPRIGHRPNHQVLRVWWRAWKALPQSRLKYEHVSSLQEALPHEPSELVMRAWEETFGTVVIPTGLMGEPTGDVMGGPTGEGTHGTTGETMGGTTHPRSRPQSQSRLRLPDQEGPSAEAVEVAAYLLAAIRSHKPDVKDGSEVWAKDIDKAIRLDARTPERLRAVIDFAHRSTSDFFWRGNLLSGAKLREHFDRLEIQAAKRGTPRAAASGGTVRSPDERAARAAERMEQERKDGLR